MVDTLCVFTHLYTVWFFHLVLLRFIKRLVNPGLGFQSFYTAKRTIIGYETMNQIRKGQILGVEKGDIQAQIEFVAQIFGVAA